MKLYRKDANGSINVWEARPSTGEGEKSIIIEHGRLGGNIITERVRTNRTIEAEIKSRYTAKYKQGYKSLADIKDNTNSPVEGELESYLRTYLPDNRTTADGSLLPMLAKVYDNTNNKIFKNTEAYIGQWKINGLRCFIRCVESNDGLFGFTKFTFQSREGTYWNSLDNLSDYLLYTLPSDIIKLMIEDNWILDGELYIPGFSINELNHIIKDPKSPYNSKIQFWCYDLCIPDTIQCNRLDLLFGKFGYNFLLPYFKTKEQHLSWDGRFNVLPNHYIGDNTSAIVYRNQFIDLGFEGLIMRDPGLEYEAGKRKMIKYKRATDGIFIIIDIIPDGIRRPDVGKLVCKNDINDSTFECHLSTTIEAQKELLKHKDMYIGNQLFIEYGERSGVEQLPFHIKNVRFK